VIFVRRGRLGISHQENAKNQNYCNPSEIGIRGNPQKELPHKHGDEIWKIASTLTPALASFVRSED